MKNISLGVSFFFFFLPCAVTLQHVCMLYDLQVGAALDFDVLKYSEDTRIAFLRVHSR